MMQELCDLKKSLADEIEKGDGEERGMGCARCVRVHVLTQFDPKTQLILCTTHMDGKSHAFGILGRVTDERFFGAL